MLVLGLGACCSDNQMTLGSQGSREGCREMPGPGAIPHAVPSLQPSYSSVLCSVVLGRAQGTGAFAVCPVLSLGD